MKNLNVKKLYVNELNHNSLTAQEIYKTASEKNVKIILVENNQKVYESDDFKLMNLKSYNGKNDNDNSIISFLKYKDFSMLFTGDAGINGINSVLSNIQKNITVLKVPHHGAIGGLNKNIVNHLKPRYSLISTGENKFGHPSLYILKLLENSIILRTDINNSIRFKVNNNNLKVLTYDIKERKYKKFGK
jgi:competence protein ComEC